MRYVRTRAQLKHVEQSEQVIHGVSLDEDAPTPNIMSLFHSATADFPSASLMS